MHRIVENPILYIGINLHHLHPIDGTWSLSPPSVYWELVFDGGGPSKDTYRSALSRGRGGSWPTKMRLH